MVLGLGVFRVWGVGGFRVLGFRVWGFGELGFMVSALHLLNLIRNIPSLAGTHVGMLPDSLVCFARFLCSLVGDESSQGLDGTDSPAALSGWDWFLSQEQV